MYLELNSFSFMGIPDSPVFLSEKDLHAMDKECNCLSRPRLEFEDVSQIAPLKVVEIDGEDQRVSEFCLEERGDEAQREKDQKEKDDRHDGLLSSLKVKLPSPREARADEQEQDGLTTPTSSDHKIPLVCPPPPRKPKPAPSTNCKGSRRRVLLDLSSEIESLFPPALLADFGKKIKRVRKEIIL